MVANKIDMAPAPPGMVGVSVNSGEGFSALEAKLAAEAQRLTGGGADPVLSRARHVASVQGACSALNAALAASLPELRAEELRLAVDSLGRLTGAVDVEAILDDVFGAFCIGK
jgi:tRNA modification GTPase